MAENDLIVGINPLVISSIGYIRGHRSGKHPRKLRLMGNKNPIRKFFGFYEQSSFDMWWHPSIKIHGSDGSTIASISCKSNEQAKIRSKELNKKLDDYVFSLKQNNTN
jgi:hypothetical protein